MPQWSSPAILRVAVGVLVSVLATAALALAAGRISGRVIDADSGEPIEGAQVLLVAADNGSPTVARSDAQGRFSFDGLAAGRYRAQAMKPGLISIVNVSVDASLVVEGDAVLTTRDLGLRRGGTLSGRVTDGGGAPVAGLVIQLEPADRDRESAFTPPVSTDGSGEFRLTGVAPGQFVLVARSRPSVAGESGSASGLIATYLPSASGREDARVLTIGAGQTLAGLDIVMQRGALFTVSGVIVNEAGTRVPGVTISLRPTAAAGSAVVARANPDGSFTVRGVQRGTYQLLAEREPVNTGDPAPAAGAAASVPTPTVPAVSTVTVRDADLADVRLVLAVPGLVAPH